MVASRRERILAFTMPGTLFDPVERRIERTLPTIEKKIKETSVEELLTIPNNELFIAFKKTLEQIKSAQPKDEKARHQIRNRYFVLQEMLLQVDYAKANENLKTQFEALKDNLRIELDKLMRSMESQEPITEKEEKSLRKLLANELHDRYLNAESDRLKKESEFKFDPPASVAKELDSKVEFKNQLQLQGVGSRYLNPMHIEGGKQKDTSWIQKKLGVVAGLAFGSGLDQNVELCMKELEKAEDAKMLPDTIVLTGHSRGACATIELARRIYIRYGQDIKIIMNITDPVPGPGNFTESKMVIPPNVESLTVIYAVQENLSVLKPLDMGLLHFDATQTTVTAIPYECVHTEMRSVLQSVSDSLYEHLLLPKEDRAISLPKLAEMSDKERGVTKSNREGCQFVCASNPQKNTRLRPELLRFHESLQGIMSAKFDIASQHARHSDKKIGGSFDPDQRRKTLEDLMKRVMSKQAPTLQKTTSLIGSLLNETRKEAEEKQKTTTMEQVPTISSSKPKP